MGHSDISQESAPARRKAGSGLRIKAAARKLFVERGYHATRPQDITREAGLGHGTFYLYYPDKRACFLCFVEGARAELDLHLKAARIPGLSLSQWIEASLNAIYDFADRDPGLLKAAMSDESVIDGEEGTATPLLMRWGMEWAEVLRQAAAEGRASAEFDSIIIGQAIAGALHQAARHSSQGHLCRTALVDNLTRFLSKALKPGD